MTDDIKVTVTSEQISVALVSESQVASVISEEVIEASVEQISTDGSVTPFIEQTHAVYDGDDLTFYRGEAVPGTLTSAAGWRIRRYLVPAGSSASVQFADGDRLFNNVWDDHVALNYSAG